MHDLGEQGHLTIYGHLFFIHADGVVGYISISTGAVYGVQVIM